jgi:hypothetical protein
MSNVKAAIVGETVILVANAQTPEPAAWEAYMTVLGQHLALRAGQPGRLVVFAGGAPTSTMRLQLRDVVGKRPLVTAVVTDSAVVRGIIGVFGLFVDGTRPFAVREWKAALQYAGFPLEKLPELLPVARQLDAEVGGSPSLVELLKEGK